MLYLITGVPGSGKTLRTVYYIKKWLEEGRAIYTNINGLTLEHYPLPDDWRDTPEGSVVVYDEAQKHFPSSGRPGPSVSEQVTAMEEHRHTGHDIILLTQHPTFVDSHARKLVGHHEHIERIFGAQRAAVHTWTKAANVSDAWERKNADRFVWPFPKELYSCYQSATVHTHKFRIPKKLAWMLAIIALICVGLGVQYYRLFASDEPEPAPPTTGDDTASENPTETATRTERDHRGDDRDPWGEPDRLDGAELTDRLRLTGFSERCAHFYDGQRDQIACDDHTDWRLLESTQSTAVVRSPWGERWVITTMHGPTLPEPGHASEQDWYASTQSNGDSGGTTAEWSGQQDSEADQ